MDATGSPAARSEFPTDLVDRVVGQAAEDADRVAGLLGAMGLAPPPGEVRRVPAEFLLDLGAASRLIAWEAQGLTMHIEAGLPSAKQALLDALQNFLKRRSDPSAPHSSLGADLLAFVVQRLAWRGPACLGAEILLDVPDEDVLIDAVARILWRGCHAGGEGVKGSLR